ncbi:hypothetical protein CDD83_3269 [Cordyceps sp. RAO-2017]|nr:hypothetical protein CDD83_3269 [Cordyceps sp. RAO-2017]
MPGPALLVTALVLWASSPGPTLADASQAAFFPGCKETPCYVELERAAGNSTRLAAFCSESIAAGRSLAAEHGLARRQAACGNLDDLETVRLACDCIAGRRGGETADGETAEEGVGRSNKGVEPAASRPSELDPAFDTTQYWYPGCRGRTCYSFLDILSGSAEELKEFCESSLRGPGLAADVLQQGVDEQSLREHCAPDPTQPFDVKHLEPACRCILGAKDVER